ncbi:MAG: SHOCT domain-containing protein [Actinomycetes bacterium]|nr:SHOCT domain-containing protein [Actinomycetes bacterium]
MGMGWGWLFGILMLVGIAVLIYLAVRLIGPGNSGRQDQGSQGSGQSHPPQGTYSYGTGNERARQVLAERYARGEIETSEYQERLRALREE